MTTLHDSKLGYSITPSMPAYARAALQDEQLKSASRSSTLLLVAFLRSQDEQGGAFTRTTRGRRQAVDRLVDGPQTPGLKCVLGQRATLHFLHDQPGETMSCWPGGALTRLMLGAVANTTQPHLRRWIE